MKTPLAAAYPLVEGSIAELYTLRLQDGTLIRWTTADVDLKHETISYPAVYTTERSTIATRAGIDVDEVTVTIYPQADQQISGKSLPTFTNQGGFDNAWLKIIRSHSTYAVHLFEGIVTDAKADRTQVELTVSAATVLLNIDMPRNVYNAGCLHTLFDTGCGVLKTGYQHTSSVLTGSTARIIQSGLTDAADYYDLGTLTMTSGVNSGIIRTVKAYASGQFTLSNPLPAAPAIGDTFVAYPGCDKLLTTCTTKFSNKPNYRGFPYIPVPESSV